ncbi:MAG: ATP-binding cassette domain-containing protein [candidate division Zixibacteria bacterium]|jgi:ABC-2 type transport system ATP-binding protein|nr:ATP-binding cassette domain-containing protein [candidate division Zixibacteria bacterium]
MIDVKNLTKYYGPELAVNDVSFSVEKGQVVGFLGPNGAGKSTTVRIICCYLSPTYGNVSVGGEDIYNNPMKVRRMIGYLPENTPLYTDMNVFDFLKFCVDIRNSGRVRANRVGEVVEICGLKDVLYKDIGELSKGYRQRVGLAQAMIHDPQILILDEPTVGLDPNQIVEIRNLIKTLGQEKTVVLCSHILPEVEATCNRVLIINRGQIAADGTPDELRGSFEGKGKLTLQIKDLPSEKLEYLENIEGIGGVVDMDRTNPRATRIVLELVGETDPREQIFHFCVENNLVLLEMNRERATLEHVFRELTRKEEVH